MVIKMVMFLEMEAVITPKTVEEIAPSVMVSEFAEHAHSLKSEQGGRKARESQHQGREA